MGPIFTTGKFPIFGLGRFERGDIVGSATPVSLPRMNISSSELSPSPVIVMRSGKDVFL
jgi:hypothetical protein